MVPKGFGQERAHTYFQVQGDCKCTIYKCTMEKVLWDYEISVILMGYSSKVHLLNNAI